ncbi:MAG: hypothetical protein DI535_01805 [Citrobacter freundii]|nr:MAG: hypothetical protein DI535_01805 [Citrobacter freundii]
MLKGFLLFVPVIFSFASSAQDTIWVKDIHRKPAPFERRYLQYTEMPDGKVKLSALLTRKAEKTSYDGHDAMLIVQTYQLEKGIDRDSSYVNPASLLPISYFTDIQSEGHHEKVIFAGTGILNKVEYKDSTTDVTKPYSDQFNGVITDDIIGSLPFKEKAVFAFHAINPGKRFFEYTVAATVEGKEDIDIPGLGKRSCWRIRIGSEKDGTMEWYTVKEQIQVKKRFRFKNGNVFYRVMVVG